MVVAGRTHRMDQLRQLIPNEVQLFGILNAALVVKQDGNDENMHSFRLFLTRYIASVLQRNVSGTDIDEVLEVLDQVEVDEMQQFHDNLRHSLTLVRMPPLAQVEPNQGGSAAVSSLTPVIVVPGHSFRSSEALERNLADDPEYGDQQAEEEAQRQESPSTTNATKGSETIHRN